MLARQLLVQKALVLGGGITDQLGRMSLSDAMIAKLLVVSLEQNLI